MASYDKGDIVMMKKAHPCGSNQCAQRLSSFLPSLSWHILRLLLPLPPPHRHIHQLSKTRRTTVHCSSFSKLHKEVHCWV